MTEPGKRPRNRPSSRATIPSSVSASLVTQTILVSALVYWAGSRTKSNTSWGVTPGTNAMASPRRVMRGDLPRRSNPKPGLDPWSADHYVRPFARRPDRTGMEDTVVKAWRVHRYGAPPEVLQLDDVDAPTPGPGELKIRVTSVTLNFNDLDGIHGRYKTVPRPAPYIPGMEVLGIVE